MKSYKVQGSGAKGQKVVTIPVFFCEYLDIKVGTEISWELKGKELILRKKVI